MKQISVIILLVFLHISLMGADKPLFEKLDSKKTGIDFENTIIPTLEYSLLIHDYYYNGSGVATGDLNNDGLPDIVLGANQEGSKVYINQGNMNFKDITRSSGFKNSSWVTGVTLVDINSDGMLDIYLSVAGNNFPNKTANLLYVNQGNEKFKEEASKYGLDFKGMTDQVTFFDFDLDGDLDVFFLNRPLNDIEQNMKPDLMIDNDSFLKSNLFINNDGKYKVVKGLKGLKGNYSNHGLGLVAADINNDGYVDIYVGNDYEAPDFMYINDQNGGFKETTYEAFKHMANNTMGVDISDFNNDGLLDIVSVDMTAADNERLKSNMSGMNPEAFWTIFNQGGHYQYMFNALQLNNGNGQFSQIAHIAGVATTDWSWNAVFADLDNDGFKDLYITNGIRYDYRDSDFRVELNDMKLIARELYMKRLNSFTTSVDNEPVSINKELIFNVLEKYNLGQLNEITIGDLIKRIPFTPISNYCFQNNGTLKFTDVSAEWGLDDDGYSQGAAYADFDLDGDLDLIVNNTDDLAFVYENKSNEIKKTNYLRVKLKGEGKNINAMNSRVIIRDNGKLQLQELSFTRGFQSANENILHFGVGKEKMIDTLEVIWIGGKKQILTNIKTNQLLTLDIKNADLVHDYSTGKTKEKVFTKVENKNLNFKHTENEYDDFEKEILIPHKMSRNGAAMAVGDIDNNGYDDVVFAGAAGQSAEVYKQYSRDVFRGEFSKELNQHAAYEDMGLLLFDADNDGDLDLYISSGSNEEEPGSDYYLDRYYENIGKGQFQYKKDVLPDNKISSSCVIGSDFDKDGDIDLFVGGRQTPGKYPYPTNSYILENRDGKFIDITKDIVPELEKPGMVTSALWTDFDNDNDMDLIVVGEWMPIGIYQNNSGKFKSITNSAVGEYTNGWWWSINGGDFDNDGDIDYVVGNLGENYKYRASKERPFQIWSDDFDHNGKNDIVLTYYDGEKCFPLRGLSCSSQGIPKVKKLFPSYNLFSKATFDQVYEKNFDMNKALSYDVYTYASSYMENLGNGKFKLTNLPQSAQISTMFGIAINDYDQDGYLDILTAGNFHQGEIETPRADASIGMFLKGKGNNKFESKYYNASGFATSKDTRGLTEIRIGNNETQVLIANNNDFNERVKFNKQRVVYPALYDEIYVIYEYYDGRTRKEELYYGSGYLSASSRMIEITHDIRKASIYNKSGLSRDLDFKPKKRKK